MARAQPVGVPRPSFTTVRGGLLQRKLTVGVSNDPLEQEAERVADQVLAAPAHSAASGAPPRIQHFVGHVSHPEDTAPASVDHVLTSLGKPLESTLRQEMEQRFGHDFSEIRVHTDARAAESAQSLNALAYTLGSDVAFASGQYSPATTDGRRLLAHELTHVLQQLGGNGLRIQRQGPLKQTTWRDLFPDASEKTDDKKYIPYIGATAAYGEETARTRTWLEIIPDAVAKAGEKKRKPVPGASSALGELTDYKAGMFSYHKEGKGAAEHEVAEAGALATGADQAAVDKSVAEIVSERAKIQQRYMKKVGGDYIGYMATPQQDAGLAGEMAKKKPAKWATGEATAHADWKKGTDASQTYTQWLATALPTSVNDPKDKKWLIYQQIIPWEGDPSTINAYDLANITWGTGFAASGGQVQELTQRVFEKSPQSRDAFFHAGIAVDASNQYVVVDTDKKWKLHGKDAELYIRSNPTLLSLMVNVAQGALPKPDLGNKGSLPPKKSPASFSELMDQWRWIQEPTKSWATLQREISKAKAKEPKQAVLDSNYENFLAHALRGIPDSILNTWSTEEAALAAHGIHGAPSIYNWTNWAKLKSHSITDVAEHIYDKSVSWFNVLVPAKWKKLVLDRKQKEKERKEKEKKEKEGKTKQ